MACAAVASIGATRNLKDEKMKHGIIGKTMKQYISKKKEWDLKEFEIFCSFGHGGVPSDISPDKLIQVFESIQKVTPLVANKNAKMTVLKTRGPIPPAKPAQPSTSTFHGVPTARSTGSASPTGED